MGVSKLSAKGFFSKVNYSYTYLYLYISWWCTVSPYTLIIRVLLYPYMFFFLFFKPRDVKKCVVS